MNHFEIFIVKEQNLKVIVDGALRQGHDLGEEGYLVRPRILLSNK